MNLKKVLSLDCILPNIQADEKQAVIEEIIDFLAASGKITNRENALKCVLERESKMSTGMQNGIAIPHGKTDSVEQLVVAIAIKHDGADFHSMDGKPSSIFVLTLSPINRAGPHIQFLAEISKLLSQPDLREKIINASSAEEILKLLTA